MAETSCFYIATFYSKITITITTTTTTIITIIITITITTTITITIVSITKFSIVIGSPRAYLLSNRSFSLSRNKKKIN